MSKSGDVVAITHYPTHHDGRRRQAHCGTATQPKERSDGETGIVHAGRGRPADGVLHAYPRPPRLGAAPRAAARLRRAALSPTRSCWRSSCAPAPAGRASLALATRLLSTYRGLVGLARVSFGELCNEKGLGEAKAAQLKAALELGKTPLVDSAGGARRRAFAGGYRQPAADGDGPPGAGAPARRAAQPAQPGARRCRRSTAAASTPR